MSGDIASALLPYTSHSIGCAIYQRSWATGEPSCTCGLDEVQSRLSATPSQRLDAATVERLARIRTSMALLQQNSEGCALNHYGSDAETHGLPGWLADTKRDLEALTTLIATEPHQHGGKA